MFRKYAAIALVASLIGSTSTAAIAADAQQGALAPGNAAGVQSAQSFAGPNAFLWLLGLAVVAGIIVAASSNGGHHHSTTTTTTP
jgi:hypothetical protein